MYTLYVGSPNETRTLDEVTLKRITDTASTYFESYTYVKARGIYQGTEEDIVMITIANATRKEVYKLGDALRSFLRQDAVAVEHNGKYERMITK
jgi:type II secretory pathway component PulC